MINRPWHGTYRVSNCKFQMKFTVADPVAFTLSSIFLAINFKPLFVFFGGCRDCLTGTRREVKRFRVSSAKCRL